MLGRIAFKEKKYKECIEILRSHLEMNSCVTDNEGIFTKDCYQYLGMAFKELNDYENASLYFEKHINSILGFQRIRGKVLEHHKIKESLIFKDEINKLKVKEEEQKNTLFSIIVLSFLLLLSLIIYFYYKKKQNKLKFNQLLLKINNEEQFSSTTIKKNNLSEESSVHIKTETIEKIMKGLKKLENEEYYLNKNCNTTNIAKKLKTNTSYLTKFVNSHYQCNFKTYINNLRIDYAISRLNNDKVFRSYSIQAIGEELGYKSSDSFLKNFKERTGLVPSYYIKKLNKIS